MPVDVLGVTAIKPIERHGMEAVKFFLYDKETGAIMGRTPKSWFLIILFYIVYYIILAAFWALMIFVFFQTIDDKVPRWITDGSIIGSSPALGVRPAQDDKLIDSSMITFNQAQEKSHPNEVAGWQEWAARTEEFLKVYKESEGIDCSSGKPGPTQFCKFPVSSLGDCSKGNYGYDKGKPCVILKLNKIYGLEPGYFNDSSALPDYVPERVRQTLAGLKGENLNQVWVDCQPENTADAEGLGEIRYFPTSAGYPSQYYPYMNQEGYLGPLIAIQFLNPTAGQLIHIECRAYAANIKYSRKFNIGRAHFEILIHNEATAKAVNRDFEA